MKNITDTSFVKMCKQGIFGAFLGIVGGMLLGLIIFALQFPLLWLSGVQMYPGSNYMMGQVWQNAAQPGMMGACIGAIIGAVFGCILAVKEVSKK